MNCEQEIRKNNMELQHVATLDLNLPALLEDYWKLTDEGSDFNYFRVNHIEIDKETLTIKVTGLLFGKKEEGQ